MKLNRRLFFSFDWLLLTALLALVSIGLATIWSTTFGTGLDSYFVRQLLYLGLALLAFVVVLYFDYHAYSDYIAVLYAAGIAALVLVLFVGRTINTSKSWLAMGTVAFQPSEFVKVLAIIALAKYYAETERDHLELSEILVGAAIVGLPTILIVLQGDLGTAVTFLPVFLGLSFLAGLKRKHVLVILLAAAVASPVGWMLLKDYQRGRIQTVFNPSEDPLNRGYQTIQSQIAIGSGRVLGKGFKQGSQGQLGFLPARHTDFIFAVLAEERGFVGSMAVLGLFLFIGLRILRTAREAKDRVGTLICVGIFSLLFFHVFINVGMVVGLLPIAGIPLPFLSAGGSSLISSFIALGLCMNIRMRRYVN